MPDHPLDFFISYTGRDEDWAIWVAQRLELAGYRVVLQAWDFDANNFIVQIEEAVRQAKWLLPILSEPYLVSKWGRGEWTAYYKEIGHPRIIPVQIEDISTRSLLGPLQRIKLIGLGEQDAEEKLLDKINTLIGPPEHDRLDRRGKKCGFPGTAYNVSIDIVSSPARQDAQGPTVPIDRDRIQLILLGDGDGTCAAAVASFRRLLDVRPERCLDLVGSPVPAAQQLDRLTDLVRGLDPEEISDVMVIFAGTGSNRPDAGVRLHVRATDPNHLATTSLDLAALLECLQDDQHRLRSCVILDAVDAVGQQAGPAAPASVPVLKLGRGDRGGCGLAEIEQALAEPPEVLAGKLSHWGPLSLADLQVLVAGTLVGHEHSPAGQIGLIPSPLAWPREGRADGGLANWCAVVSDTDGRRTSGERVTLVIDKLAAQSLYLINQAYGRRGHPIKLAPTPAKLVAGSLLSSPRSFAYALEQVCCAELAVFDLTNFEPAVMILLGIRAVIRRGLTVCVAREHDAPWLDAEPPFHLREVSMVTRPGRDAVQARILEGIKQFGQPGSSYADLPCFDLIRGVPPDPEQRQTRAYDAEGNPSILALVPFDPDYVQLNWTQIKDSLPATARDETIKLRGGAEEVPLPALQRTLDLDSPRVVSAQLFEAMRLTDFCLVDLTSARPNVLFELGVRLAANRLHPVVIVDPNYPAGDSAQANWLQGVDDQLTMLRRLLQPVPYSPTDLPAFTAMVERHLEFRRLLRKPDDPRAESLLGGLPPAGVYDVAWRHAVDRDEVVTMPVEEHLQSGGEALLVDESLGQRHLIYPTKHRLTNAAEHTGLEYLVAAWLYLHFRAQAGHTTDEALAKRYQALTDKLTVLLAQTGDEADASFVDRIDWWLAGDGSAGQGTGGDHG
jgi:hypothetical protein